jgi:integrase
MRLGNILTLKWENLDFISNTINIKVKDRTKDGGKNLSIPMIPQLSEILQSQPHISDYVFNFNGKPIKSIMTAWRNIFYCRDANGVFTKKLKDESLPYVNFHTLRHTAATWILQKTNNLRITKEILGHANINTTLKYAHVLDEEKRNALTSVFK